MPRPTQGQPNGCDPHGGQAIVWFHPLVWWIGARLIDERERACDGEVLRLGSKPQVYAEGILNVCRLYVESPLKCVAGVTGANLKRRVEAIMRNRTLLGLSFGKRVALAVAGMAAIALPIVLGVLHAQPVAPTPKWEAASVRSGCVDNARGGSKGAAKEGRPPVSAGGPGAPSPGRLTACGTVTAFVQAAYALYANGVSVNQQYVSRPMPIEGGPAWIKSDAYTINAKAEGEPPRREMLQGPMERALLEDRFKLKVHRETREIPVYELTVAKGGSKLERVDCAPRDYTQPLPPVGPGQKPFCGVGGSARRKEPNLVDVDFRGMSLDEFSKALGPMLDRPVIDKTGLMGMFNFRLEFARNDTASDDPSGDPSIFTAFQDRLGLKLEPAKGPGEFLVIDSVARPSEN